MNSNWGRNSNPNIITKLGVLCILTLCPFLLYLLQLSNKKYGGSIYYSLNNIFFDFVDEIKILNISHFMISLCWIFFQYILALIPDIIGKLIPVYVGGIQFGQKTLANNILEYNINGLQSFLITIVSYYIASLYINFSFVTNEWLQYFFVANIFGFLFSIFGYYKAHIFPTHQNDNKYSGSVLYDFIMGIEHNPRMFGIDFKMFFNGRVSIIGWFIINIIYAQSQYQKIGFITNSMILVNILQGIYIIDFLWNETWYLKTIDIACDHYGFYMIYGCLTWLPFFYTLQGYYLINNVVILSNTQFVGILCLGLIGYIIFRTANYQKDQFKKDHNIYLFGKPAEYINTKYITTDNIVHKSKLLISGTWGYARHLNYTGDLVLSLSYCLTCGFDNILPYSYFIFMFILLVIRCYRDEYKCYKKYGRDWSKYCNIVKYRLIPFVY